MLKKIILAMAAVTASFSAAQAEPSLDMMALEDGALTGPGASLLLDRLPSAQFILVGEDHGFADSPEIALALAKASRKYGVVNHVVEEGPLVAEWAADRLRKGGVEALAADLQGRPMSLAFLSKAEDAALAEYFVKNAPRGADAIWGIDQEFIASTFVHLENLKSFANSDAARKLTEELLDAEKKAFADVNFGAVFLSSATPERFAGLRSAFEGSKEAGKIIDGLEESAAIYQSYNAGRNFDSNTDRIALMRRQFFDKYRAQKKKAPRALFKFGAIHVGKGTTTLNTFDQGSLSEGVAAANGLDVLRVLILPAAGKQLTFSPSPEGLMNVVDFHSDDAASLLATIGVEEADIPENGYAVIDLEPIRRRLGAKGLKAASADDRFYLLGYDFLITTRGARAATMLAK